MNGEGGRPSTGSVDPRAHPNAIKPQNGQHSDENVQAATPVSDLLYTDVWVSMGREKESADRIRQLSGYQINAAVIALAQPGALVMHCLPAYRGKEIDEATFEANAQTIFDESENRLHVQKAILNWLVS